MKSLSILCLTLLFAVPCYSQEALPLPTFFADLEAEAEAVEGKPAEPTKQEAHNAYLDKITADPAAITSDSVGNDDALRAELVEIRNALNYLYLTRPDESRVREIVKEELARVNVRYADANGHVKSQEVSIGSNYTGQMKLNPGEKLLSYSDPLTGQTVHISDLQSKTVKVASQPGPVSLYSTPTAEVFVTSSSSSQPVRTAIRIPTGPMRTLLRGVGSNRRRSTPTTVQTFYPVASTTSVCVGPNCR